MTTFTPGKLLQKIDDPSDLRKFSLETLSEVCQELRQYIIDVVSVKGGHFGASLGVVELTVALHYVFNTPIDQLVWDVGHQAYSHKILTGRRDAFPTNRTWNGLSGFPKRSESIYDTFGVGHSSTSISAALGMAVANQYQRKSQQHIAVIGDGAMTAGMAFEALNHAGMQGSNLLVVLNDNCMSIDENVGALKEYLTKITTSKTYNKLKDQLWQHMGKNAQEVAHALAEGVKSTLLQESNFFESLNFRYFGPIDGHDVKQMVKIFQNLKELPGPKLLHCVTKKGKGYLPSENGNSTFWHAPGLFDKTTGDLYKKEEKPQPPRYQDVFGHTLLELAEQNSKIMGITPAMPTGCSMNILMKALPERAFDVGIAEQHAVTFAAGLATQGLIPFCNIYSSFMQRAYDQVIHDVALQNLPVVLCLDRGGLVGADGATHHGVFDLAYLRILPNMIISAPLDEIELRNLMFTAQLGKTGTFSIRYPRGNGMHLDWRQPFKEIEIGKGQCIQKGTKVAIVSLGAIGQEVKKACQILEQADIFPSHYDLRFLKPLDQDLLHQIGQHYQAIVTVEDGCIAGGMGSSVLEFLADQGYHLPIKRLGIPDQFIEQGTQEELYTFCGYNAEQIAQQVEFFWQKK